MPANGCWTPTVNKGQLVRVPCEGMPHISDGYACLAIQLNFSQYVRCKFDHIMMVRSPQHLHNIARFKRSVPEAKWQGPCEMSPWAFFHTASLPRLMKCKESAHLFHSPQDLASFWVPRNWAWISVWRLSLMPCALEQRQCIADWGFGLYGAGSWVVTSGFAMTRGATSQVYSPSVLSSVASLQFSDLDTSEMFCNTQEEVKSIDCLSVLQISQVLTLMCRCQEAGL